MIPQRLTVRNFLCYRENVPTLDFTGLHLACLCGPNGGGKSALLDAITWCLWGQARGKTHDDLISHGADECQVDLTFEARGQQYFAVRSHSLGGKRKSGASTLALGLIGWVDGDKTVYDPLTGATIRETQEQITSILGMDYDTFINSAFLLQGRADEFSSKPPAERKAVLAKILGLEEYDVLQAKAKVKLREMERATAGDEGAMAHMGTEVEEIGDPGVELSQAESTLRDLGPQLEAQDRTVADLKEVVAGLERKQADLDGLRGGIDNLQYERSVLGEQQAAARQRVLDYQALIEQTDTIRSGANKLGEAKTVFARMEHRRRAHESYIGGLNQAAATISSARTRLESQQESFRQQASDLKQTVETQSDALEEASKPGTPCALCDQPLGQERRDHVKAILTEGLNKTKDILHEADNALVGATEILNSENFAPEERDQQDALLRQIKNLAYDDDARTKAYSDMQELEPFGTRLTALTEAQVNLPQEQAAVQQAMEMLETRTAEVERLEAQHTADSEAVKYLPSSKQALAMHENNQRLFEEQRAAALDKRGYLKAQVDRLATLQAEMAEVEKRLAGARDDQAIYSELVTAFGKSGVQAMLIETVAPRLEEEANLLLRRMTDGAMYLTLETQKEKRSGKGEMAETLEIYVSDELGPRNYEMYSGGEAFRVNLALRIALSRVLAQRTGAPMPVLFIDEGFGSQDMAGRDRVMSAIGAISDDFEKIIVITHLDDLKDLFPARIEVQKGSSGSTFKVS